ncbi:hypothetical protein KOR42_51360 [Thalassoglobus neptunius]|uniref:Flagellar protein FliS n=1 Tax=Thalassoglobus neptunius TaxID=1938619 RepID=A0A5C5VMG8_9PLAN|nr:hypothetical protein [Thalassoglobus neptunius]TWT39834.1 hypothetical protein KOR42_51360 [Thalassoglobus neptunius]
MPQYSPYHSSTIRDWTRIDMLLSLYGAAEDALTSMSTAIEAGETILAAQSQIRTMKLLVCILEGIESEQNEIAAQIQQLCLYMIDEVAQHTLVGAANALKVLRLLHEGFQEIREEAIILESNGTIPKLSPIQETTLATG